LHCWTDDYDLALLVEGSCCGQREEACSEKKTSHLGSRVMRRSRERRGERGEKE
jgi:hypothetical protein